MVGIRMKKKEDQLREKLSKLHSKDKSLLKEGADLVLQQNLMGFNTNKKLKKVESKREKIRERESRIKTQFGPKEFGIDEML